VRGQADSSPGNGAILWLMGKERPADPRCEPGEPPSEVLITVFADSDGRRLRERLPARHGIRVPMRARGLALVVVVIAAITATIAIVAAGGGSSAPRRADTRVREPGATGVAAAYGYPHRCVSVTISTIDPAFARADFDHGSPCGRYTGYSTAIFHRVDHEWEPALEAVSYPCPVARIPHAVQRELGVCP
jgi:hypothetical protein